MRRPGQKLLLIFVKTPLPGKVKTRLAADIGDEQAVRIYRQLIDHTKVVAARVDPDIQKQVWYSGKQPPKQFWESNNVQLLQQPEGSLGQKMASAFMSGFQSGFQKIVIVGSDCYQLRARHISQAFERLKKFEVVLGPSLDGGYYLLGMSRWMQPLFKNKSWSTDRLYTETVATLRQHKLRYSELEPLNDIDTLEDLEKSSLNLTKPAE